MNVSTFVRRARPTKRHCRHQLLAPKHARDSSSLQDYRGSIAAVLETHGHRPTILEKEPDEADETLRSKFLRLAATCEQAVLIWPEAAAMATTADEIVLLHEVHEQTPLEIVLILHEHEAGTPFGAIVDAYADAFL